LFIKVKMLRENGHDIPETIFVKKHLSKFYQVLIWLMIKVA